LAPVPKTRTDSFADSLKIKIDTLLALFKKLFSR